MKTRIINFVDFVMDRCSYFLFNMLLPRLINETVFKLLILSFIPVCFMLVSCQKENNNPRKTINVEDFEVYDQRGPRGYFSVGIIELDGEKFYITRGPWVLGPRVKEKVEEKTIDYRPPVVTMSF